MPIRGKTAAFRFFLKRHSFLCRFFISLEQRLWQYPHQVIANSNFLCPFPINRLRHGNILPFFHIVSNFQRSFLPIKRLRFPCNEPFRMTGFQQLVFPLYLQCFPLFFAAVRQQLDAGWRIMPFCFIFGHTRKRLSPSLIRFSALARRFFFYRRLLLHIGFVFCSHCCPELLFKTCNIAIYTAPSTSFSRSNAICAGPYPCGQSRKIHFTTSASGSPAIHCLFSSEIFISPKGDIV